MKKLLYIFVVAIVASACSGPKYTASFNYFNKPSNNQTSTKSVAVVEEQTKVVAQPEQLLASTSSTSPVELKATKEEVRKTYIQMTKTERKALRTHLRSDIKSYVKEQKKNLSVESTNSTSAMDNDLKLAAIFGAVGVVAMFIGGDVFWIIGGIALIIGVVFFVKWLVRQ
jgi:hypothetical protein